MTAKNRKEAEPVFCQVAALRYAKVLNELGISKEAVLEAGNIFEKSQELKAALVNPVITKETKHNIIDKVFSSDTLFCLLHTNNIDNTLSKGITSTGLALTTSSVFSSTVCFTGSEITGVLTILSSVFNGEEIL